MPSSRPSRPTRASSPAGAAASGAGTGRRAGCGCLGLVLVGLVLLALLLGGLARDTGDPQAGGDASASSAAPGPSTTAPAPSPSATAPAAGSSAWGGPAEPRSATPTSATPTRTASAPPAVPAPATSAGPEAGAEPEEAAPSSSAAPARAAAEAGTALALLDTIEVKGRAPKTGYERELFGPSWADVDRNGCDTRNDILRRDLVEVTVKPGTGGCTVLRGTLHGPYTGSTIAFVSGQDTSSDVQIDHVVALSDAWQKGAQSLDADERLAFANDPLNLLAVDGPTNQAKSDGDAATWLPPRRSHRCPFVARQIAVKAEYGLWVTSAERDAMARVLGDCPDQQVPARQGAGAPAVAEPAAPAAEPAPEPEPAAPVEPEPAPKPEPAAEAEPEAAAEAEVFYENCTAARAAGAAPLLRGEPGYRSAMDGDDDGVACE